MRHICHGVESPVSINFSHSKNAGSWLAISVYGNLPGVCRKLVLAIDVLVCGSLSDPPAMRVSNVHQDP